MLFNFSYTLHDLKSILRTDSAWLQHFVGFLFLSRDRETGDS